MIIKWDSRDGIGSYPYPHNATHGFQKCSKCQKVLRSLELDADYIAVNITCCSVTVHLPGIEDVARFSGLRTIVREAENLWPIFPGEIPVNASEHVQDEFSAFSNYPLPGDYD